MGRSQSDPPKSNDQTAISSKRKREDEAHRRDLDSKRKKLLVTRRQLPIWTHQKAIRAAVRDHDVLVLSGETGSGKSTQVPQFLLDMFRSSKIAVTQPRRVAAISLVCSDHYREFREKAKSTVIGKTSGR